MNKNKPRLTVIKLAPVQVERIWGGTWLREQFGYVTKSETIGETWVISAHPSGNCKVLNSIYKGMSLSDLYDIRRDLFANDPSEKFPLLVKFIDAKEDLSVQVHPNDDYARRHENQNGKSEAWLILDCKPKTDILIGHQAQTREQLRAMIYGGRWEELLTYRPLQKGEIINIPSGTLHAICAGTSLIEIQQSSDITYRVFDYDRLDAKGHKRELHLEKSIDVIDVPHVQAPIRLMPKRQLSNRVKDLLVTPHFKIQSLAVKSSLVLNNKKHEYLLVAVLSGSGKIGSLKAEKGESFIVTSQVENLKIQGKLKLIIASK